MEKIIKFNAWVNPLAFLEIDLPWAATVESPVDYETFIKYICTPGMSTDIESLRKRYLEISREPKRLFVAPNEERILSKLVWPLRHAKACYMVGNHLGTLALGGMVAEMIAILLFEISNMTINGRPLTESDQRGIFGSSFERLSQDRRVEILNTYNLIDSELKSCFDIIRTTRRKYLHLYSQDHSQLGDDAIKVFNSAVTIVVKVIGQDVKDGKVLLNPALIKYLEQKEIIKDPKKGEIP